MKEFAIKNCERSGGGTKHIALFGWNFIVDDRAGE
jgi:hypothetical protein